MSDQPARRRATIVTDFTDAGSEERFTAGDTPMLDAGTFANYEAAGLVTAGKADEASPTKASDTAA